MTSYKTSILGVLAAALFGLAGCSNATVSSSPTVPSLPSVTLAPAPSPTPTPTSEPTPSPTPTPDTSGIATRIVIASLKIDLPVVGLPPPPLVYCNVAMWWNLFVSPGLPGATYILAYAKAGMFLPLLQASQVNNGMAMVGMRVDVYTSADWLFTYQISAVHRHVAPDAHALDGPNAATGPELWLQTSEGGSVGSTLVLVEADLVSATPASHTAAQPSPQATQCG